MLFTRNARNFLCELLLCQENPLIIHVTYSVKSPLADAFNNRLFAQIVVDCDSFSILMEIFVDPSLLINPSQLKEMTHRQTFCVTIKLPCFDKLHDIFPRMSSHVAPNFTHIHSCYELQHEFWMCAHWFFIHESHFNVERDRTNQIVLSFISFSFSGSCLSYGHSCWGG